MKVYFIRHGETEWNKRGLIQGSSDIPLNDYGRELAEITEEGLKDIPFHQIFTSPYIRAQETASILSQKRNLPILIDSRIKEFGFGEYEGKSLNEMHDNPEFKKFWKCFEAPEEYIPEGSAESYESLLFRTKHFLTENILPFAEEDKNIMIVAHGAVNRAFLLLAKELTLNHFWDTRQPNCAVNIIEYTPSGAKVLEESKLFYTLTEY